MPGHGLEKKTDIRQGIKTPVLKVVKYVAPILAHTPTPAAALLPKNNSGVEFVRPHKSEIKSEVWPEAKVPAPAPEKSAVKAVPLEKSTSQEKPVMDVPHVKTFESATVVSRSESKKEMTDFGKSDFTESSFIKNVYEEPEERIAAQDDEDETAAGNGAWITVLLAFLALVVLGVGVWKFVKKQEVPAKLPPPTVVVANKVPRVAPALKHVEKYINAAEGGTISLGQFQVVIPADALENNTVISLELVAKADFSKFETTDFFRMLPEGLKFIKPVTVKVPYYEEGLRVGSTIKQSALWFWHEGKIPRKSLAFRIYRFTKRLGAEVVKF